MAGRNSSFSPPNGQELESSRRLQSRREPSTAPQSLGLVYERRFSQTVALEGEAAPASEPGALQHLFGKSVWSVHSGARKIHQPVDFSVSKAQ